MDLRRTVCGVVLVALMVTGSEAQLDVCGTAPLNSRIVGGDDAPVGAWPWQASVYWLGILNCGGSLINNQWVLTAAQCTNGFPQSDLTVYLGRDTLTGSNLNMVSRKVSRVIQHPSYSALTMRNDIALLQLSSPVTFNNYIKPVCLAASGSRYDGSNCWVTGFGRINTHTPLPDPGKLQEVNVPIVSNKDCAKVYGSLITDNHMCAGPAGGEKGICSGDAGGPMVSQNKTTKKWVQAAVASFVSAQGCAVAKQPGGYTRVSQYQDWINSQITTNKPGFIFFNGAAQPGSVSPLLLLLLSSSLLLSTVF